MEDTHYRTLGLASSATDEQIKTQFRRLALIHHPDQAGGHPQAQARFLLILNAWKVLGDPLQRQQYDRYLHSRSAPRKGKVSRAAKPASNPAGDIRDSLNSLLWDVEDLLDADRSLGFQKDLMRILTFLDQWVLSPAGYVDYFMEARGLERLNPASYLDFICQPMGRLSHFPFTSVSNYYYDIRKRMNRYLEKLDSLPWLEPIPGKQVRYIDAYIEAQNLSVHYLAGLRQVRGSTIFEVPRFVASHPDFG